MFARYLKFFLIIFLTIYSFVGFSAFSEIRSWMEIDEYEGIKVYRRHSDREGLYEFRGLGKIEASIPKILAIISDAKNLPKWIEGCVEGELLYKNFKNDEYDRPVKDYYQIMYGRNAAPWPFRDRDYVLRSEISHVPESANSPLKIILNNENIITEKRPPIDRYVRMPLMRTTLTLSAFEGKLDQTTLDFSILLDPGGVIPDSIINLLSKNLPKKTLLKLRNLVKTDTYDRSMEELVKVYYQRHIGAADMISH